jgi:hypothetical protein
LFPGELWRIEIRRRLFTSTAAVQTALRQRLDFYSTRRSHLD